MCFRLSACEIFLARHVGAFWTGVYLSFINPYQKISAIDKGAWGFFTCETCVSFGVRSGVRGAPGAGNAGVVGRVIHQASLIRDTRVRLRRAEENAAQRRVSAPV